MFRVKNDEKKTGCYLLASYIGDYHMPLQGSLLTNQNSMKRDKGFDHWLSFWRKFVWPDFLGGPFFQPKILSDKGGSVL